ncbi:hypothetical protein FHS18_001755 [Paenibacillus phyllosphaerae]|uniref:Uncharacterized protein n=1 Tax=Paenibacillus phyllosphaerae TaxID=274593 RepID=A0A7W5FM48_9BACL|nr:hypothetical protein [Paenibacillus phyllosphaerae]MBB3109692.1 hypothetical protein [Paenibacillus phyllosphaerae]
MPFAAGQSLETDKDFELAVKHKVLVFVSQNNVRQRPITTISGFNEKTVILADGKRFLRSVNKFRTLTEEETNSL